MSNQKRVSRKFFADFLLHKKITKGLEIFKSRCILYIRKQEFIPLNTEYIKAARLYRTNYALERSMIPCFCFFIQKSEQIIVRGSIMALFLIGIAVLILGYFTYGKYIENRCSPMIG